MCFFACLLVLVAYPLDDQDNRRCLEFNEEHCKISIKQQLGINIQLFKQSSDSYMYPVMQAFSGKGGLGRANLSLIPHPLGRTFYSPQSTLLLKSKMVAKVHTQNKTPALKAIRQLNLASENLTSALCWTTDVCVVLAVHLSS